MKQPLQARNTIAPFIGVGIGGVGMLIGLIATYMQDVGAGIFFTIMLIGIGVFVWFVGIRPFAERERLLKIGRVADGTIIAIAENGSSLKMGGSLPKAGVTIQVEVRPVGVKPYVAETKMYISVFDAASFQPGTAVKIKYDPADPKRVTIANESGIL